MFKLKWIFKNKSAKINSPIYNIYKFPNDNLLLVGQNIYIYDSNLNLIYSKINGNYVNSMNACIINDDLFIIAELRYLNMTLYSKATTENILYDENNNLINKQYNTRILVNMELIRQIIFFKENNDLICLINNAILIYDFDQKKIINASLRPSLWNQLNQIYF